MGTVALKLLAVGVLVFLNGFFVAAEFALVKVRDTQLNSLIRGGNRRARVVRRVIHRLDSSLSACQLGITLASLALGWIGEPVFMALLQPVLDLAGISTPEVRETVAVIVGFATITFLHITAGEQAPKWMAIQKPLPTALWVAWPLHFFHQVSYPFIWVLNRSSQWMLRAVGLEQSGEEGTVHSEEELRLLFATSQRHSHRTSLGRNIVLSALDLRHRVVREVMRPRQEISAFHTNMLLPECRDIAEKSRYSRFPLCENGDLDRILGVVHIKDLYGLRASLVTGRDLVPVARKLIYLPPTARLETLLQLFLDRKLHMAVVVDEYGGTLGIVTLENILEELVGQIQDEFDQEKPLVTSVEEHIWDVSGALPLHDLQDLVGTVPTVVDVTTVSGWLTQRLGGFPKPGDAVAFGDAEFRVEEMEGLRVAKVRVTRLGSPPGSGDRPSPQH
jgi:CBS domain containing-hemolysin-like protein